MVVSDAIQRKIEEKVKQYDDAKEKINARIKKEIRKVAKRLEKVEKELLKEVDKEFGENPFSEFLCYANSRTDADANRLLAEQRIPENFGPDKKSFSALRKKIDYLKEWQNFAPENLKAKSVTWDSITVTWDKIGDATSYQIEVDGSVSSESPTTNTFTKSEFLPDTEHSFRVRTVRESSVSEWSDVAKGRTLKIPIPSKITAKSTTWDTITLTWDKVDGASSYQIEVDGNKSLDTSKTNTFTKSGFLPESGHSFKVRTVRGNSVSEWSGVAKGRTLKELFERSTWKECPGDVDWKKKYSVDGGNPRVATKVNDNGDCTIKGNTRIPLNKVTSWGVKILKSRDNNGGVICIGVAPSDINQNVYCNYDKCGWYFGCFSSTLISGPPHNYRNKAYGPRKESGQYVHTGDTVGVVMDTTKGDLSFVLNGVNCGAAYCGIPLDKPLVPCIILYYSGDSVELDLSEVKENKVDTSIPVPSNVIITGKVTWDSITLTWEKVSDASFYQIEVDRSKLWESSTTNSFTKRELLPGTEHSFRVRTVRRTSMSGWSDVVKGRTLKKSFECVWKKCPDDVDEKFKYSVDEKNPRIATKVNDGDFCTIIGNTHILPNKVSSWSIKILKSKANNGNGFLIGVAPSNINQNYQSNHYKRGWYFDCYCSNLWSGPPHNYRKKEYGPRKGSNGQYVHTGDSVGVVMDTIKGDLSFVLSRVNYGVAYEGIPLDKPLVPCVLIWKQGDSVELDLSEVKETEVDRSIPIPFNTAARSTTCDSITLTWEKVSGASFYQIEVDGSKLWESTTANSFTRRGLLPETEHSFRVRSVRGSSVSGWSGVVKERTLEKFSGCVWKECPDDVYKNKKYSVDEGDSRIAIKVSDDGYCCTIIGNTHIPPNTVTSWSIKILNSEDNDGNGFYIGVAPSDIKQNDNYNYSWRGWYFGCYYSVLRSGPPHNYDDKDYGPRKEKSGQYVNTGDSVGVVMNTTRGELSFVLNGVNLGAAYEGIPLDKPLIPCVVLWNAGDSVELDTSEVKENEVDSSVPAPPNVTAKSITWDSTTLIWDEVSDTLFYQIEVDGNISCDATTTNTFTKKGLLPDKGHSFRVRAVRGSSVSKWSGVVKVKTLKAPEFFECVWKECPGDVKDDRKYIVDEGNPRIATKINDFDHCTIIGNAPIPLNTVISWSIKILKSKYNGGSGIFIGIAPFDIDQNEENNNKHGWHFDCWCSKLFSGPPHNYSDKAFGPLRGESGQYVGTGDSVGVVMDTTNGDLSFILKNMNLGIAYEGIPLDKPLVPCVLLEHQGDSVGLDEPLEPFIIVTNKGDSSMMTFKQQTK